MADDLVVKVGGSLYDLPDLGRRLRCWLTALPTRRVLLVPGGGAAADWIREFDRLDGLGEERAHWLALRALSFTAHVLAGRLGDTEVVDDIQDRETVWKAERWPVLDMHAFARADEAADGHLPHLWAVTSDSLAARAALVAGIRTLILLKSVPPPAGADWQEAARQGVVDQAFPDILRAAGARLQVTVLNFRQWLPPASSAATPPASTP
jgi:aspartokinase-like uncharacterized kinase